MTIRRLVSRVGKAKASRESGGWVPWTEEDMAKYRARWPLGTEARLMFDILHYTHLRLGDASRFGAAHLQRTLKTLMVKVATEKSQGRTTATVPVHRDFAVSPPAARNAGIIGMGEVFTGKLVNGRIRAHEQEGVGGQVQEVCAVWPASTSPRRTAMACARRAPRSRPIRTARRAQMMAMFGWRDPQDARALHRQSEPGQACDQRNGRRSRPMINGEHRRSGDADRPEQNSNFRE